MAYVIEEKEKEALITCSFCRGKGKDPFGVMSFLSICYACLGKKSVWVPKPLKNCVYCQGTGVSPLRGRNYCIVCHGTGVVQIEEPNTTCSECGGSGTHKPSGFYCTSCHGRGVVSFQ